MCIPVYLLESEQQLKCQSGPGGTFHTGLVPHSGSPGV